VSGTDYSGRHAAWNQRLASHSASRKPLLATPPHTQRVQVLLRHADSFVKSSGRRVMLGFGVNSADVMMGLVRGRGMYTRVVPA